MFRIIFLVLSVEYWLIEDLAVINRDLTDFNNYAATVTWNQMIDLHTDENLSFLETRYMWRHRNCLKLKNLFLNWGNILNGKLHYIYQRHIYLICRGTLLYPSEVRYYSTLMSRLQRVYHKSRLCWEKKCYHAEPELTNLMATSRNPELLMLIWTKWHDLFSYKLKHNYHHAVIYMNRGAQRNGYNDIGEVWREELEINNLEKTVEELYEQVLPLYKSLHAVVRYRLLEAFGENYVSLFRPLPAHLLGDLWGQNWEELIDIVLPRDDSFRTIIRRKFNKENALKFAEIFYISLGFSPIVEKFRKNLIFKNSSCHSSAINMFQPKDFRVVLCNAQPETFLRTIFHELGHVQYYLQYAKQPALFQDNVNAGIHESIGDAIYLAALHSKSMGLLLEGLSPISFLLPQALSVLPQISFSLALEKWRWAVFRGEISMDNYNKNWWALRKLYQGIEPVVKRPSENFDALAKSHISDNIPYIRYFVSGFLQFQIFESLCVNGTFHLCDISERDTQRLRYVLSQGNGMTWYEAVKIITGPDFNANSLLRYFKPLEIYLNEIIKKHNIPIGWD